MAEALSRHPRPWRRPFAAGVLAGVLAVVAGQILINNTTLVDILIAPLLLADTPGQADAIVVLGAGIIHECVPNQHAVQRVLLAARLWKARRAPQIVFTGGPAEGGCPIAQAMANLGEDIGLVPSSLHVETVSRSTRENAVQSAPLLRRLGVSRVLLVTDAQHMRRAAETFAALGFGVERASVPIYTYSGLADNVWLLQAGVRELLALGYYRLRGWAEPNAVAA